MNFCFELGDLSKRVVEASMQNDMFCEVVVGTVRSHFVAYQCKSEGGLAEAPSTKWVWA